MDVNWLVQDILTYVICKFIDYLQKLHKKIIKRKNKKLKRKIRSVINEEYIKQQKEKDDETE